MRSALPTIFQDLATSPAIFALIGVPVAAIIDDAFIAWKSEASSREVTQVLCIERCCAWPSASGAGSSTPGVRARWSLRTSRASTHRTIAGAPLVAAAAGDDKLQSEFLLRLVLETQPPNVVGNRVIVPVSGGTFEGPKLKGTIVGPSGDWIHKRPDGASVLDVRLVLQTDDAQKIYMSWHGIAYAMQGGALHARITPVFETGAARYVWLNNVVSVGVHQPMPGKVSYRVYQIL